MSNVDLLSLENVTVSFTVGGLYSRRTINAVENVSFRIPNEPIITALIGESGSGKTTIAKAILGLVKPTSGRVLYKGRDIFEVMKEDALWYRKEVQAVFQDPYEVYNPFYKVERVLRIPIQKFKLASDEEEAKKLIDSTLEAIGLRPQDVLGRYPHQLSGGERQRLLLARVLLIKPKLVVADEPVSMIDVSLKAIFLDNLRLLKEKYGISCLYIEHDLNTAYYVADNSIVLNYGRVVEIGDMESIIREPLHPYTNTLVNSILTPDPGSRKTGKGQFRTQEKTLRELRPKTGCIYQKRCPKVWEKCLNERPDLIEVKKGHYVACFLYK
ncbi:MAG: ABC transporter ATP-binding protein [Thermofilaceae archaeon]|nr:ABC transporter ATP-binding protein [Thermofilaceae archaeon]